VHWNAEPHWQWWQRMMEPEPLPVAAEPTPWEITKLANRLAKKVRQVDSGFLRPRATFAMTGFAQKEIQDTRRVLAEAAQTVKETR
jgi:hypothetical protein